MTKRVLIIGGYGNFGSFIAAKLAEQEYIKLIIAGRSLNKAQRYVATLSARQPAEAACIDINQDLYDSIEAIKPDIVIHTSGPFQAQGYGVAKTCIEYGCHYIDLADGRDFVNGIIDLDSSARANGLLVVSGASSVPCLTAALLDYYQTQFYRLEHIDYGITTAQKTNRGLATTAAILGYVGKPFETLIAGETEKVYGWQNIHFHHYHQLGKRLLGNCDVPDLSLFPERYPDLKTIRFYAGLEVSFLHIILWSLSGLVRVGLIKNLQQIAPFLLSASGLFDWAGSSNSGFHMQMSGRNENGNVRKIGFELIARDGDGPYIPCTPAILLAKKLATHQLDKTGASACVGFITKDEYLAELESMNISWREF